MRIERRRQIEQRLQQLESAGRPRRTCGRGRSAGSCESSRRRRRARRTRASAGSATLPDRRYSSRSAGAGSVIARVAARAASAPPAPRPATTIATAATARGAPAHLNSRRENSHDGRRRARPPSRSPRRAASHATNPGGTRMPCTTCGLDVERRERRHDPADRRDDARRSAGASTMSPKWRRSSLSRPATKTPTREDDRQQRARRERREEQRDRGEQRQLGDDQQRPRCSSRGSIAGASHDAGRSRATSSPSTPASR